MTPIAWKGVGWILGGPIYVSPDEPRSELCAPWTPVFARPAPLSDEQILAEFRRMQRDEEAAMTFDLVDFHAGVRFAESAWGDDV